MTRPGRLLPLLAAFLLVLTGCSGDTDGSGGDRPTGSDVPEGMVLVRTDVGTVARPKEWTPTPATDHPDHVAGFQIKDAQGQVVGQMDVFVNETTPGTGVDALDGAIQGARMPSFPNLRHTRREFTDVPGAEGGFLTESTYTTADTDQPARSLDQVALAEDGTYLLVRISAADEKFDEDLFQQVVDTMRLDAGEAS